MYNQIVKKPEYVVLRHKQVELKGFDCHVLRDLLRRFRIKAFIKVNPHNSKETRLGRNYNEQLL